MTSLEVGKKLVELCKQGKNVEAIQTLYSPEVKSIEADVLPGQERGVHGLEAVIGKTIWWAENHEVHSSSVLGPFPHDDRFAVYFNYDVTNKQMKQRFQMEEIALYTVKNGKVVKEEFFFTMG